MSDLTRAWERYERGRAYNNSLSPNQYDLVNTNIEFFAGNQWFNAKMSPAMRRLERPVFNVIKRVASLFVASLTSSAASVSFDELSYYAGSPVEGEPQTPDGSPPGGPSLPGGLPLPGGKKPGVSDDVNGAEIATAEVQNLLEKFKMDYRIREALFDGAQTGDYCAHFWWDPEAIPYGGAFGEHKGEIQMELVDGINVMFGNPNTPDVERQPYILIVGRDTIANLQKEAGANAGEIIPDAEYLGQAGVGGRTELPPGDGDGKALYVYMYEKKPGKDGKQTVHVTKATRSQNIFEDVDTGLSRYPIAWGNWEKQKNQYHGRALVTGIIPNQIFINKMFAMVMRHLQLMGFPKTVYNAEMISHWTNEVGEAIAVRGLQPGQNVSQVAYNLQPADMSAQIIQAIDKAVAYTKDCLGATDAQLGNVKPDNTSALMVLQSSAEVPLENTRAGMYEWLEDVGGILLDMMGTYYGQRPVVRDRDFPELVTDPATGMPRIDPTTGTLMTSTVSHRVMEDFDFTRFKNLWFNVRVNAGATSYYSEIAMVQTLDNLRREGGLEFVDYLERMPDKYIPMKAELIRSIKERLANQPDQAKQPQAAAPAAAPAAEGSMVGGPLSEARAVANLAPQVQQRYANASGSAKRALRQVADQRAN